ncbi:endoplasmic reticulum-derived transport vesicle ERV46 [Auriculariales sp. MPI-PUGE-AT-0066]|nr:endoplasmic reticulum-derived transport vesicle ERV46 [Auriculariales sp. MPI-PUGE-AT-0066]
MDDVKVKTRTGALLTIISLAFVDYRRINHDTSMVVDKSRGEKVTIPCYLLSLDVVDISGERQNDVTHNILKTRIDQQRQKIADQPTSYDADPSYRASKRGRKGHDKPGANYCGSCYGGLEPEGGCCQTCESVRQAYINRGWAFGDPDSIEQCKQEGWKEKIQSQMNEGCNVEGRLRVNKVAGSIQFSFGRSFQVNQMTLHELVPYLRDENVHDWRHRIGHLYFSSDDEFNIFKSSVSKGMKARLGIEGNPLDGAYGHTESTEYMFQYFLKVVSTQFRTISGEKINAHQYSSTHFDRDLSEGARGKTEEGVHVTHGVQGLPGVFFNYEISPMRIIHAETRQSFAHFITSTCAIVGGVLTVAGIFDSLLFTTQQVLKKSSGGAYGGKLM